MELLKTRKNNDGRPEEFLGCDSIKMNKSQFKNAIRQCKEYTRMERENYGKGECSNYKTYREDITESMAQPTIEEKWNRLIFSDVFHDAIGELQGTFNNKVYFFTEY